MANSSMVAVNRNLVSDDVLYNQLDGFYRRFLEEHRKVLQENRFPLRVTLFGQPHDSIIAVDTASVIVVACKGNSTHLSSRDCYVDLSSQGTVTPQALKRSAAQRFGWERMVSLYFDRQLLNASDELQRAEFRRVSERMVEEIQRKQKMAKELGITEAFTYLANARARFDAGGEPGFSDCKANCRNAIVSLMRGLTGTENIHEAVKKLNEKGLLGEREKEVIDAIESLVKKLHGLASKTGTHPPLATEEDAHFTLRLTEAVVEYVVSLVAKAKGL